MKTNDRYLDKNGQWQPIESPKSSEEVVAVVAELEPEKIEIPRVAAGAVMRLQISLDFALWRRLKKAGVWWKYFDMHPQDGRIVCADCDTCKKLGQECGMRRVYGKAPKIVFKCLKCGAEQLCKRLYGWRHG